MFFFEFLVFFLMIEIEVVVYVIMSENLYNGESGLKGVILRNISGLVSLVNREFDIDVLVDDDVKDEGEEELLEF